MTELRAALSNAFAYLSREGVDIPADIWQKALVTRALKADGDISDINAAYHDQITEILTGYFESGGAVTSAKNQIKRAMVESFGGAFDGGWVDGGQDLPADEEALAWFNERVNAEMGFIDMLLENAKELRKEEEPDYFTWITSRADAFTNSVSSVYNTAVMFAKKNQMLTWQYGDADHCATCESLNGQRHRASWYIAHDYIPGRPGAAMDCGGYRCKCSLVDPEGNQITI